MFISSLPGKGFGQTKIIIGFGDSLTEGCGNEISTCGVSCRLGDDCYDYENNLQSLLDQHAYDFTVNNFGYGGETTADALSYPYRFYSVLSNACNNDAEYILIMEGTNDLLHYANGLDVKFNLGVMIDKSRERGLIPLLATIPPDPEPEHDYKDVPLMNQYIKELAEEKGVVLVDLYTALSPYWNIYTDPRACYGDLTHPNRSGFEAMGSLWYKNLSTLLPKKSLPGLMLLLDKP
ncbi:MAG: SGNH/GDSL hydrolase family protein [Proteobacteria bacterium]|nr:SGNH/GDSL hydrolase family protein [Pseudomonadota bacterium]MBU1060630.1 SGNH/GDSL hydrolase family protein [Pseudomonadota bacterium]